MCARRSFSSDLITDSRKQIAVPECAIEPYKAHLFGRPSGKTNIAGSRQNDGVPIKDKGGWGGPPHQTVVWDTKWACNSSPPPSPSQFQHGSSFWGTDILSHTLIFVLFFSPRWITYWGLWWGSHITALNKHVCVSAHVSLEFYPTHVVFEWCVILMLIPPLLQ